MVGELTEDKGEIDIARGKRLGLVRRSRTIRRATPWRTCSPQRKSGSTRCRRGCESLKSSWRYQATARCSRNTTSFSRALKCSRRYDAEVRRSKVANGRDIPPAMRGSFFDSALRRRKTRQLSAPHSGGHRHSPARRPTNHLDMARDRVAGGLSAPLQRGRCSPYRTTAGFSTRSRSGLLRSSTARRSFITATIRSMPRKSSAGMRRCAGNMRKTEGDRPSAEGGGRSASVGVHGRGQAAQARVLHGKSASRGSRPPKGRARTKSSLRPLPGRRNFSATRCLCSRTWRKSYGEKKALLRHRRAHRAGRAHRAHRRQRHGQVHAAPLHHR